MSAPILTGGPAFPQFGPQIVGYESDGEPKLEYEYSEGMRLRDYFAAKAMQGILANPKTGNPMHEIAGAAYAMADAMINAREGGAA